MRVAKLLNVQGREMRSFTLGMRCKQSYLRSFESNLCENVIRQDF